MAHSGFCTIAIPVKTAHNPRRSLYDVGIGYGDSIDNALTSNLSIASSVNFVF